MKIICIGDNVCDCYHYKNKYYPGGNCVNVAVNAKKNGAQESAYIGIFGTDDKAAHLKYALAQEGIITDRSRTMEGKTGQPGVFLDEAGDRIFRSYTGDTVASIAKLRMNLQDLEYIKDYDICHTSCYSWLEEELPKLAKIIDISYDFSSHIDTRQIEQVAPWIKYAFVSVSEKNVQEIEQLILEFDRYPNVEVLGLTMGKDGALFVQGNKRYLKKPAKANVVDTMGAGDSFIAAFLVNWQDGKNMEDSLVKATQSAARTCEIEGGFGYPHDII